jgi:hypothetical protein
MVELLGQPDLADPELVGAPGLRHHVVDDVDGLREGNKTTPVGILRLTGAQEPGIPLHSA